MSSLHFFSNYFLLLTFFPVIYILEHPLTPPKALILLCSAVSQFVFELPLLALTTLQLVSSGIHKIEYIG